MLNWEHLVFLVIGLFLGFGIGVVLFRVQIQAAANQARLTADAQSSDVKARLETAQARIEELRQEIVQKEDALAEARENITGLKSRESELKTALQEQSKAVAEKISLLDESKQKLLDAFRSLSAEALKSNNQAFLELANANLEKFQEGARTDLETRQTAIKELVRPVKESLDKVDSKIEELEKARVGAYESLSQQVRSLLETQNQLRSETSNLVQALRAPTVRGRWGEIQLKRVVEMAGMLEHCDFYEQESVETDAGRLRPDMVVRLPGEKNIVIDAKAPLSAYLEAIEEQENEAVFKEKIKEHARQLRSHITLLSRKNYWDQFQPTPEFVVLFLPGEIFFSAALQQDPALIEYGVDRRVILATPTTLIALLRAVAYGWRQEGLAKNAQQISDLGQELYKRLADMGVHMDKLGKSLGGAVEAYNSAVGSLESRVMVSARRFKELDSAPGGVEVSELGPVEKSPRNLQAPEFTSEDTVDGE